MSEKRKSKSPGSDTGADSKKSKAPKTSKTSKTSKSTGSNSPVNVDDVNLLLHGTPGSPSSMTPPILPLADKVKQPIEELYNSLFNCHKTDPDKFGELTKFTMIDDYENEHDMYVSSQMMCYYIDLQYSYLYEYDSRRAKKTETQKLMTETMKNIIAASNLLSDDKKFSRKCSMTCSRLNRSWVCCGFYAPVMYYIYKMAKDPKYNEHPPSALYAYATSLYKIITGYGHGDKTKKWYNEISKFAKKYNMNIDVNGWNDNCVNWIVNKDLGSEELAMKIGKIYMMNIVQEGVFIKYCSTIHHFIAIRDTEDSVILADSWSHGYIHNKKLKNISRGPIVRKIDYTKFVKMIKFINDPDRLGDPLSDLVVNQLMAFYFLIPIYNDTNYSMNSDIQIYPVNSEQADGLLAAVEQLNFIDVISLSVLGGKSMTYKKKSHKNKTRKNRKI